jgi:acyl-CoA thioester hydrolase
VNEKPRKTAPRLADYPHQVRDIVRFRDMDAQRHVNNAVYSTYFETGRVVMFRDPDLGVGVDNVTFVLARAEIDFLRELHWPGDLTVGTALKRFGRRSFVVAQAVFQGEACAAMGDFTMVTLDKATRDPIPLPEAVVARLSPWTFRGSSPD